eukprot:2463277-Pyramimonas_sp.AAC.1
MGLRGPRPCWTSQERAKLAPDAHFADTQGAAGSPLRWTQTLPIAYKSATLVVGTPPSNTRTRSPTYLCC